jgi:hypothetical protein
MSRIGRAGCTNAPRSAGQTLWLIQIRRGAKLLSALLFAACNSENGASRVEAGNSPAAHPVTASPTSGERPEEVLERFLTTYDGSLWDLEAAFDFAGEYFLKELTDAQREEVRVAIRVPRPGANEAMAQWLRQSMKSFSLGEAKISGDQAVVEATLTSPTGAKEKGWFSLVRKDGAWKLVSNGSAQLSAEQLKKSTLEMYKGIEKQFGWSGVVTFLREAIAKQRPPQEVLAELRGGTVKKAVEKVGEN